MYTIKKTFVANEKTENKRYQKEKNNTKTYTIQFTKNKKGIVCRVSNEKNNKEKENENNENTFCIVLPGNVFILLEGKWQMLDTTTIPIEREFKDLLDKASYDLIKSLQAFSQSSSQSSQSSSQSTSLLFRNDESVFLESLVYDLFNDPESIKEWIPGKGKAKYIELTDKCVIAVYEDGTIDEMIKTKNVEFESYTTKNGLTIPLSLDDEEEENGEEEEEEKQDDEQEHTEEDDGGEYEDDRDTVEYEKEGEGEEEEEEGEGEHTEEYIEKDNNNYVEYSLTQLYQE